MQFLSCENDIISLNLSKALKWKIITNFRMSWVFDFPSSLSFISFTTVCESSKLVAFHFSRFQNQKGLYWQVCLHTHGICLKWQMLKKIHALVLKRLKIKFVIIYSPSGSSKPVWMSLFWTQRKLFWRMWKTEQFWGTIDFHYKKKNTMEVNGAPELLCSNGFGTTWGWVNDDNFHFWVNCPFKAIKWKITQRQ